MKEDVPSLFYHFGLIQGRLVVNMGWASPPLLSRPITCVGTARVGAYVVMTHDVHVGDLHPNGMRGCSPYVGLVGGDTKQDQATQKIKIAP